METRRGSGTRRLAQVRRVLIVDDNHDSAELLALVLTRAGHETRVAHDPVDAIPMAVAFRPNVAFLDIGLPGMDGFELMRILRARPELEGCQFVAVTGYEELGADTGSTGFDVHLLKPVDLNAVAQVVLDVTRSDLARLDPASA
jgi:CheY-like chemotaxis protein